MKPKTLAKVMSIEGHQVTYSHVTNRIHFDPQYGGPTFRLKKWMRELNEALIRAHCKTPDRVAMFLAQVGAESGSFRYTEELASGSEYNGRTDLGNIYPGDGPRFKGRTYIQITGRHNYTALSKWAFDKGYVPSSSFFVDYPEKLAESEYIFLGPVWYWTVARNMNKYADAKDIEGATRAVNGGLNNLSGRTDRWKHALTFGNALLPTGVKAKKTKKPPKKQVTPKHSATPTEKKKAPKTVTVQAGDTLSKIASAHDTTWQALQKLNNLHNPNKIYVGQTLRIR